MRVVIQAVQWHDERAVNAMRLMMRTNGTIVWDADRSGGYATFLRVLDVIGDDAAWMLEDDVDLCTNWADRAAEVVKAHPHDVINAFSLVPGEGWRRGIGFYNLHCTYFPAGAARAIREFADTLTPQVLRREALSQLHDHLVGLWLDSTGRDYWLHSPSLVQHRPWPSLIDPKGRGVERQSPTFLA